MGIKSKEKGLIISLEVLSVLPVIGLPFAIIALFISVIFIILQRFKPESFLYIGHYLRCLVLSIAGIIVSITLVGWGLKQAILIRGEGKFIETEATLIGMAKSIDDYLEEHPECRDYSEIPVLTKAQLKDGWGHPFWIRVTKDSYQVISMGPVDATRGNLKGMKSPIHLYLHNGILETHAPFNTETDSMIVQSKN